jgi:hypothetical protein
MACAGSNPVGGAKNFDNDSFFQNLVVLCVYERKLPSRS